MFKHVNPRKLLDEYHWKKPYDILIKN